MAFKSQSRCPVCDGQLRFNYETLKVECEHCDSVFTVEEISNYVNKTKSSEIEKGSAIYDKDRYDEVLTTKNLENLNSSALAKRMRIALVTERYDELSRYIDEMIRREPDNTLPYEYRLLMKYKVFRLEELVNVDEPFYLDDEYRIIRRIGDRFKVDELDAIEKKAKQLSEERKQKLLKEEKEQQELERKNAFKKQILRFFLKIFAFFPSAIALGFLIVIGKCRGQLAFIENGNYFYAFFALYATLSVGIAIILTKNRSSRHLDEGKVKIYYGVLGFLTILGVVLGSVLIPKADFKFNPAEDITLTATSITDEYNYSEYETTVYFTVTNGSNYSFESFYGTVSFSNGGVSLGTWDVTFKDGYSKNSSKDISVKFRSDRSDLYYASFEELTIKYKIQKISKDIYDKDIEFDTTEKFAKQ